MAFRARFCETSPMVCRHSHAPAPAIRRIGTIPSAVVRFYARKKEKESAKRLQAFANERLDGWRTIGV